MIVGRGGVGSARALLMAAVVLGLGVAACSDPQRDRAASPSGGSLLPAASSRKAPGPPVFVDATATTGLDFEHRNGMSGEMLLLEVMGSGAALFDYDNDSDLDLFLVQGGELSTQRNAGAAEASPAGPLAGDRLYRNDLTISPDGAARARFVDVTRESGIVEAEYGMGVATGDYDRDGWTDLYVTNFGRNRLWRNNGDGTFSDQTEKSATDDPRWSVPAAFLDFDRDGWLDLYVGNYVDFRFANRKECVSPTGTRQYCGPLAYEPLPDSLFRNLGDGTFENVTLRSGLREVWGHALGTAVVDFNNDGWLDLYVANDSSPNQLWVNLGTGRFENQALVSGCAVNELGKAEASMGVAAGDFDGDGDEDLFLTHLDQESNTLYENDGTGVFVDVSIPTQLAAPSWSSTGFGTVLLDYDNDGLLDLAVANGAVKSLEAQVQAGDSFPLRQPNQLFRNLGDGRFSDVSDAAGPSFQQLEVSRGLAAGDIDNDGDRDLVLVNNQGPARVLLNQVGRESHWVGIDLETHEPRGTVIGSQVVVRHDGRPNDVITFWQRVGTAGSYASASDPRALFGLGEHGDAVTVEVRWTSGRTEQWHRVATGRYTTLVEGTGTAIGESGP